MRIIKKYEALQASPAPDSFWKVSPLYDNPKEARNRADGDDYSFVNYMGDRQLGVKSMMAGIRLSANALVFVLPVYLIQGAVDILTGKEITRAYFDSITAPQKKYILLADAAHGINVPVLEMQYKIMKEYIVPFIKSQQ